MNFADAAITYGENGIRCGCGKPAHSNLVACAISDEELAALTTLLAAPNVAPGPWVADGHEINQDGRVKIDEWVGETCNVDLPDAGAANAALIVAARNALPGLLAEIHRLRAAQSPSGAAIAVELLAERAYRHGNQLDPEDVYDALGLPLPE